MPTERNLTPILIKAVIAGQLLIAMSYTGLASYMLAPDQQSARAQLYGLHAPLINIILVGFMVVVPWFALGALTKSKPWGRDLALFFVWLNLIAISGGNLERHTWPDKSELAIGLFFSFFAILLSLKPVRRYFQRPTEEKR
jgi:hypothetical protein